MTAHGTLTAPFALARYLAGDAARVGLVVGGRIRPLSPGDLGAANLNAFLAAPDWERLGRVAAGACDEHPWLPLDSVVLTAPVEPRQVLQAGANYREHVMELMAAGLTNGPSAMTPEAARAEAARLMDERRVSGSPFIFIGLPTCVVGDEVPLVLPSISDTHDWELELAIVIGAPAFQVQPEDAMAHVAGYTIVNDVSTREFTFRSDMREIGADWFRSKNSPGFLPTGPYLVPAPYVAGGELEVTLELNGEVKQRGNTSDLLFGIPKLIAAASQTVPLLPGDLLLTGSPPGNGQHWGRFLQAGDVVRGTIEGLGTQTVRCVAPPAASDRSTRTQPE